MIYLSTSCVRWKRGVSLLSKDLFSVLSFVSIKRLNFVGLSF